MSAITRTTPSGTAFAALPIHGGEAAPTLLLLAMAGMDTLTTEPYCRVGSLLHQLGWNVVSLDLPCHGADRRNGEPPELAGWAARTGRGEDIVAPFQERANDVVDHLIAAGFADPAHIAAAGTSRGGFMAFHAAASSPHIRAIAAFSPVTDLLALTEFAGLEEDPLACRLTLLNAVEALAGRAAWITIGDQDERVGTRNAIALAEALSTTSCGSGAAGPVTLRVLPTPGHCSFPEWHDEAAEWLQGEGRRLPGSWPLS